MMRPRRIPTAARIARLVAMAVVAGPGLDARFATAATTFRMPVPEVRTLENGLQVAVFRDARLPIVQTLVMIPAGSAADPPGQSGTAYLTAELLTRGTSSRDAAAYAEELDRMGGSVTASAARDYSTLAGSFLAQDLDAGLEIMSDAVLHPVFADREFGRLRSQTLTSLGQLRGNPTHFAAEQIWPAAFPRHPYAPPVLGTPEMFDRITIDGLRVFYRHWRPDRATLAIAGDVTIERAFAAAREWFGRWQSSAEPPAGAALPPPTTASSRMRIRLFDAPELRDSEIRFGIPTLPAGHADVMAVTVANALLGGAPSSRLRALAAQGALGREVRSQLVVQGKGGLFSIGLSIGRDSTGIAVRQVKQELEKFIAEPPDEASIAAARRVALNALPMSYETLGSELVAWSTSRLYGLGEGGYDRQRQRLENLTRSEMMAAAGRWLDPERLVLVVVGPALVVRPQLEKLGAVEVVGLDAAPPAGVASRATSAPPGPAITPQQRARGRDLVRKAVAAHGGAAKLRGIEDSVVEADATLSIGGQELKGRMVQIRKEPFRMLSSTSVQGIDTDQTLNGDRAWSTSSTTPGAKPQDMDSLAVAGLRSGFRSDLPHLLLDASDPNVTPAALGRRHIGDRETEAVEVRMGNDRRILYFDARTYQLVALDQHETDAGSSTFSLRRTYGDPRTVQGILWPFSEERLLEGQRVMKLAVTRVALDGGVPDTIFEKPEPALPPAAR